MSFTLYKNLIVLETRNEIRNGSRIPLPLLGWALPCINICCMQSSKFQDEEFTPLVLVNASWVIDIRPITGYIWYIDVVVGVPLNLFTLLQCFGREREPQRPASNACKCEQCSLCSCLVGGRRPTQIHRYLLSPSFVQSIPTSVNFFSTLSKFIGKYIDTYYSRLVLYFLLDSSRNMF